ncbi:hypothetical protein ABPG75_001810 [Micractinium tetrahymenae]
MIPARPSSALAELLDEPGLEGQNSSLVFAPKLALHRSSLAESYFKSKSSQRMAKPVGNSELAQLRKKAGQMGRDFQTLLSAHERQEAAVADLRQKVRQLRSELEGREKALELARRTVERLMAEKGALEAGAAGTQAYVRKLEARLLSVRGAVELQQICRDLKGQLDSQAHALHEAEARASAAEEAARVAALDAACLKRGLELAAEQLTRSAGAEVPGTLLKAVARGQEEALELSVQLSDAKQQVAQLTSALEQARAHLQAQQTALAQQQNERQQLQQRAEAAEAALEKQRAATAELRKVLDALRPKAGALAEERASLRQQLELERTAAAEAQKEVKQLRAALRQKAATEAALRDELRRALAGEGATPSLAPRPGRPATGAGMTARSGSRVDASRSMQQQQQQPAVPSKRAGSAAAAAAGTRSPKHLALRQGTSWQQPGQLQPHSGSRDRQDLIPGETSPTRALARLQEQRRAQQGSRLGSHKEQPDSAAAQRLKAVRQAADACSWDLEPALEPAWQLEEDDEQGEPAALVPSSGAAQQQRRATKPPRLELPQPGPAPPAAAAVLPVQEPGLMQLYTSALDEQIALLESDLANLESAPSPIAQLKQLTAARGRPRSHEVASSYSPIAQLKQQASGAAAGKAPPAGQQPPPPAQQHQQQQKHKEVGSIAAWRPNSAFQAAFEPPRREAQGARGMQQLMSPGGDTPVPPLWRSNPLAGSPPPKQQQQQQQRPAEAADVQVEGADGALTVRGQGPLMGAALESAPQQQQQQQQDLRLQLAIGASPTSTPTAATAAAAAPAAVRISEPAVAAAAALPGASLQQTEDWLWGQLQQALSPVAARPPPLQLEAPGSVAASTPSLRLPGDRGSEGRQREDGELSASSAAASEAPPHARQAQQQQQQQQQVARPAASQGSCGEEGAASLSHHWDLPSPGPGNSDWLSNDPARERQSLAPATEAPGTPEPDAVEAPGAQEELAAALPQQRQQLAQALLQGPEQAPPRTLFDLADLELHELL